MDASKYAHSPTHKAIVTKDHEALKNIISNLPWLCNPAEILTESISLSEESKADAISAVINGRDVPNRDTPLHLAVKLRDDTAAEMLMMAGADWSLQNEQGWSALQEAICQREEKIARIIVKQYQPIAWAKWCRRLPQVIGVMRRMRDFYMEITFQFESSVIPFISKIAPSDTYKIWKRGANLRADMTLAGFDGFKIQRMDQSVLFLGDGSEDGRVPSGSLFMVTHKDKEVMNALEGAGAPASDAEVQHEVAAMCRTNIFRPGIDVTEAVLLPQTTWRRQERTETVGPWKTKVYDMHNVVISLKSRKVPGAMTDGELFGSCNKPEPENEGLGNLLTDEERRQLEAALKMDSSDLGNENGGENVVPGHRRSCSDHRDLCIDGVSVSKNGESKRKKKGWLNGLKKKESEHGSRSSFCVEEQMGELIGDSSAAGSTSRSGKMGWHSRTFSTVNTTGSGKMRKEGNRENEYKKGLRPTLWLSPNFPLQTEELLPLLDILASKVKAIRRLRELLTTKLPMGTFPVKVAIPVVPTIRVLVTFTKFEELQPLEEFLTPPSSPTSSGGDMDSPSMTPPSSAASSASSSSALFEWIKAPHHDNHHRRRPSIGGGSNGITENIQDPFVIPPDYKWVTAEEKRKKRMLRSLNYTYTRVPYSLHFAIMWHTGVKLLYMSNGFTMSIRPVNFPCTCAYLVHILHFTSTTSTGFLETTLERNIGIYVMRIITYCTTVVGKTTIALALTL